MPSIEGWNYRGIMIVKIKPNLIWAHKDIFKYCLTPYPGHPKGCPNYNKKKGCPPKQKIIYELLDFKKPLYVIYTEFDIESHVLRMKKLHPSWSERQCYCCLYWQPKARKSHKYEMDRWIINYTKWIIDSSHEIIQVSEAHGVDVNKMMKHIGVELEWPPRKISRIVSIGGFK